MTDQTPPSPLARLIAQWRAEARRYDSVHATLGSGWKACADDLEAALRDSDSATQGWQPIETAPNNGSWMLGWNSDCGCFVWREGPGLITGEDPAPTHWMPLPPSPPGVLVREPQP